MQVQPLAKRRLVPRRDHLLHNHELAIGRHCPTAVREDLATPVVIPIVQNLSKDIDVGIARNRCKEVTADRLATVGDARTLEKWLRDYSATVVPEWNCCKWSRFITGQYASG